METAPDPKMDTVQSESSCLFAEAGSSIVDSGLYCPHCEYNLTGTIAAAEAGMGENRCPECGTVFDPQELRDYFAGKPAPIAIWDDESQSIVVRYIKMCFITWFMPWRLPRMVPMFYYERSLKVFHRITMALTVPLAIFVFNMEESRRWMRQKNEMEMWAGVGVFILGVWAAAITFELVLANLLDNLPKKIKLVPEVGKHWYGIIGFFRSFLLIVVGMVMGLLLIVNNIPLPCFLIPVIWLWFALGLAINDSCRSFVQRLRRIVFNLIGATVCSIFVMQFVALVLFVVLVILGIARVWG